MKWLTGVMKRTAEIHLKEEGIKFLKTIPEIQKPALC
jgi:hypothetical protein